MLNKLVNHSSYKKNFFLILLTSLIVSCSPDPQKQYGPYAKETEVFTSGKFCEDATDPSTSWLFSQSPGGAYGYWTNIIRGRYTILGIDADTPEKKQQLKNAWKTWQDEMSKCNW